MCVGCAVGAVGLILLSLGVVLPGMTYSQYESTIMGLLSTDTDMGSDAYKEWMKGGTGVSSTRSIFFPKHAPANNPSTHQRNICSDAPAPRRFRANPRPGAVCCFRGSSTHALLVPTGPSRPHNLRAGSQGPKRSTTPHTLTLTHTRRSLPFLEHRSRRPQRMGQSTRTRATRTTTGSSTSPTPPTSSPRASPPLSKTRARTVSSRFPRSTTSALPTTSRTSTQRATTATWPRSRAKTRRTRRAPTASTRTT